MNLSRLIILGLCTLSFAWGQTGPNGTIFDQEHIGRTTQTFPESLDAEGGFGTAIAVVGDLDGDGVEEVAVGAPGHQSSNNSEKGKVFIMFMNTDGTVKSATTIADSTGGFTFPLRAGESFGESIDLLGDLDNDGRPEIAVSAPTNTQTIRDTGAVFILSLNNDGTVFKTVRITEGFNGFSLSLDGDEGFGTGVTGMGDMDGDGVPDMVVGHARYRAATGAVYTVMLNTDGTVKSAQRISTSEGGMPSILGTNERFGQSVANLGDRDGDDVPDVLVGCWGHPDGGSFTGAAFILFLKRDGTMKAYTEINGLTPALADTLDDFDYFGYNVAALSDYDGDGVGEIAVSATRYSVNGRTGAGRIFILFATAGGSIRDIATLAAGEGNYRVTPQTFQGIGEGMTEIFDVNGDGIRDLMVGVPGFSGGISGTGAIDVLQMNAGGESTISGTAVLYKNPTTKITGNVYLFDRYDRSFGVNGYDTAFVTRTTADGKFQFQNVLDREYILQVAPDNRNTIPNLIPSYYKRGQPGRLDYATRHTSATPLVVMGDSLIGDVAVISQDQIPRNVSYSFTGVSYPGSKNRQPVPLPFAPAFLYEPGTDSILAFGISDAQGVGKLNMESIDPNKRFDIVLEFPGLPMNVLQAEDVAIPLVNNTADIYFLADSQEVQVQFNMPFTVGVTEPLVSVEFSLFPNPAKNAAQINWNGALNRVTQIRLYNGMGKLVQTVTNTEFESHQLNIANLTPGKYFVALIDKKGQVGSKTLIVQ